MRLRSVSAATLGIVAALATGVGPAAQSQSAFNEELLKAFSYRNGITADRQSVSVERLGEERRLPAKDEQP